jgi:hypothetical protein
MTTWAALTVGAALIALPAAAGPAAGAPPAERPRPVKTPQVQLQLLDQDVDAGASFDVRVQSKNLGKKAKVFLQHRKKGTRSWDNVAKVGRRGVSTVPGTAVGVYTYRLIVTKKGKTLATSKGSQLRAYGDLALQQYCAGAGAAGIHSCADGTTTVGGAPFTYHATADGVSPSARFDNSSCGSVTLHWAGTATVSLTQDKGGAAQTATNAPDTLGAATFRVGSKGWNLQFTSAAQVVWDATFSCFTTSGTR